jgi:hypothetical protein
MMWKLLNAVLQLSDTLEVDQYRLTRTSGTERRLYRYESTV